MCNVEGEIDGALLHALQERICAASPNLYTNPYPNPATHLELGLGRFTCKVEGTVPAANGIIAIPT